MSEVRALMVQFSLFPTAMGNVRADKVFGEVFGIEPDETQSNKMVSPQKNFLSMARSEAKGIAHTISVLPGRIDIQVGPAEQGDISKAIATVDAAKSLETLLIGIANLAWEESEFIRLAVICNVIEPQATMAAANEKISELSGLQKIDADTLDVMVQINRRTEIGDAIEINRVVQYSCLQFQSGQFHLLDGQLRPASVSEHYASSVNLDFNTAPGAYTITSQGVYHIFSEIVELLQRAILDVSAQSVFNLEVAT